MMFYMHTQIYAATAKWMMHYLKKEQTVFITIKQMDQECVNYAEC